MVRKKKRKGILTRKTEKKYTRKTRNPSKMEGNETPAFLSQEKKRNSVNIFFSFESKLHKRMLFLQPQKPLIPHRIVVNIFHAFAANPIGLRYEVVLIVIRVGPSSFCVRAAGIPDSN